MSKKISWQHANTLENKIRKVYKCYSEEAMGIASTIYLESNPLDAALVILSPIVKEKGEIEEISNFIDKYICIFKLSDSFEDKDVNEYIEQLENLINKYYDL